MNEIVSSVNAAQFVRNFAECRTMAERQPLFVSSYGRTTHALIGVAQFEALQEAAQSPRETTADDLAGPLLGEFGAWLDIGLIVCDPSLQVESLNPAAAAMAGVEGECAAGRSLEGALPGVQGSVLCNHAMRVATSRAPTVAEFPSPFRDGCWLRLRAFWWKGKVIILLTDITQEVGRDRLADMNASVVDAFSALPGSACARLSPRGTIDGDSVSLAAMLGLSPARLAGVGLIDLIDLSHRPQLREAMETVLRGGAAQCVATRLICNTGTTFPATLALAPMIGSYGSEGAVAVISRAAPVAAESERGTGRTSAPDAGDNFTARKA